MPTQITLFIRALIIYALTIIIGSLLSALFIADNNSYLGLAAFGMIITGVCSIPNIFIMYIGFNVIYRKNEYETNKWLDLSILAAIICIIPIGLYVGFGGFAGVLFSSEGAMFFAMILPYLIMATIFLFSITYTFDKRNPIAIKKRIDLNETEILDDDFIES